MVNSAEEVAPQVKWQLFPNPASAYFTFNLLDYYPREAYLELYDGVGRRVMRQRVLAGWNTVEVANLPSGVYFWQFRDVGQKLAAGKVVKVE